MKLLLIRHGATPGNLEKRYVGRTDESLTQESLETLGKEAKKIRELAGKPAAIITSPMKRCLETAETLFPGHDYPQVPRVQVEDLSECDFGEFENKNYKELSGNQDYQRWIDSNGTLPFPGGESREAFKYRSLTGFQKAVTQCIRNNIKTAALVIHGGTIMNIMEEYADRPRAFYEWHVKNGGGYLAELEPALWQKGRRELCVREAYMEG